MRRELVAALLALAASGVGAPAAAANLVKPDAWPALVADQVASRPGDSLTVLIFESASASNASQRGLKRTTQAAGILGTNVRPGQRADVALNSSFSGDGRSGRSDQMVAQISVRVTAVAQNGDLLIEGAEALSVNGEQTRIEVRGRVRPADIAPDNTVLSSRVSDARIVYEGGGFTSQSAKPGLLSRVLERVF